MRDTDRDEQYDLLTAALIGVAVGAGTALLLSALTPERPRPTRMQRAMKQGRKLAGRGGSGRTLPAAAREQIGAYLEGAREAITDTVESELKDLRRALRRRRRRLGL